MHLPGTLWGHQVVTAKQGNFLQVSGAPASLALVLVDASGLITVLHSKVYLM